MDKELNDYLEQQFGATNTEDGSKQVDKEAENTNPSKPADGDYFDISSYLTDDDEPDDTQTQSQVNDKQDTLETPDKRTPTAEERLLQAEKELAALRAERDVLSRFATRPQETETAQTKPQVTPFDVNPFDDGEVKIDPELQQTFGASMPFVQAVAKQAVQEYHNKYVKSQLGQYVNNIAQQVGGVSNALTENQYKLLQERVRSEIPEAVEIAHTPEWQGFLKTSPRLASGGFTYADLVQDGIRKGNIGMIKAAVEDFKALRQGSQPQAVAPGKSGVATPSTAPKTKTLAYSKYQKATRDYEAGLISYDTFMNITDTFQEANIQGLVDYNR